MTACSTRQMVASASRTRLIRLFPTVFKGTHVNLDEVRTAPARTITVDSPGINAYADGEYVCRCRWCPPSRAH